VLAMLGVSGHKSSLPGITMSGRSYCCSNKLVLVVHHRPEKVGRTSSIFGRRRSCSLFAISGVESLCSKRKVSKAAAKNCVFGSSFFAHIVGGPMLDQLENDSCFAPSTIRRGLITWMPACRSSGNSNRFCSLLLSPGRILPSSLMLHDPSQTNHPGRGLNKGHFTAKEEWSLRVIVVEDLRNFLLQLLGTFSLLVEVIYLLTTRVTLRKD
jgi:hypothetical protein